jgi:WD40 repeat protein
LIALAESDGFYQIGFLPGGKTILGFAWKKGQLAVWNLKTRKIFHNWTLPRGFIKDSPPLFAASPDGKTVVISRKPHEDLAVLFDVSTGKETRTLKSPGGRILSLAFSPDGRKLACGTNDKKLCVWELVDKSR